MSMPNLDSPTPEAKKLYPPAPSRHAPPWWAWMVISIGFAELAWFGQSVLRGNQEVAVTNAEIADIRQQQASLSAGIATLDIDVQTLNVNVAVLTQKLADRRRRR